jgi:hypothetical protein
VPLRCPARSSPALASLPPSSTGLARNLSLGRGLRRDPPRPGIRAFRTIRGLQERSSGPHAAMTSRIA